jgi:hypothetical protein
MKKAFLIGFSLLVLATSATLLGCSQASSLYMQVTQ